MDYANNIQFKHIFAFNRVFFYIKKNEDTVSVPFQSLFPHFDGLLTGIGDNAGTSSASTAQSLNVKGK
jgi:hypothetical protein